MAYEHEDEERRSALCGLSEAEYSDACGHTIRGRNGVCIHCGDLPDV